MLSYEHEAKIPELNVVIQVIQLLCSLIVKSGWYVSLLYIIIDLSSDPDTNLPSFNILKQFTLYVWLFNVWIGSFNLISKLLYLLFTSLLFCLFILFI